MASVFISYRRADSASWAEKLFGHISMRFGKDLVFEDVESLKPGQKWMDEIKKEVHNCDVFLVVIGPGWLGQKDDNGQRRIDNEKDVLRIEVSEALNAKCTVIPVLVGGAELPSRNELPDPIVPLIERQLVELRDGHWNEDVKRLIEELRNLIQLTREMANLSSVQKEAYQMQLQYFEIFENEKNPAGALECGQKLSKLLDRHLPLFPEDSYLKVCRGYSLKNEAMALRWLGRTAEFGETLGEAERIFRAMRSENPQDCDAWNGSGSVEALRGNYSVALEYIDKCLEICPDHEAALHDKQQILTKTEKTDAGLAINNT